jgi:hypothetical protein
MAFYGLLSASGEATLLPLGLGMYLRPRTTSRKESLQGIPHSHIEPSTSQFRIANRGFKTMHKHKTLRATLEDIYHDQ